MNVALWIIAGLLAVLFLFAGANKLFIPHEKLARAPGGGWVNDFSPGFVKGLGALEILGAIGLILPPHSASRRFWCRWRPSGWRRSWSARRS